LPTYPGVESVTLKNKLESRIRGWFPQDIVMVSTKVKVNTENVQPSLLIPANCTLSSTKYAMGFTIFLVILYGYTSFRSLNIVRHPISLSQAVAFVVLGLVVSAVASIPLTKNKLDQLQNSYRSPLQKKELFLPLASAGLLFVLSYFVSLACQVSVFLVTPLSFYTWSVSFFAIRAAMFEDFERKENMRIMQGWFIPELLLIPKAPDSKVNNRKSWLIKR
jgi:hypothetical protein